MVGILAHADVGYHHKLRHLFLQCPDGLLDNPLFRIGVAADGILGLGNAEKDDRRDPESVYLLGLFNYVFDRLLVDARHGGDFFFYPGAERGKHRVDKVVDRQGGLADHSPKGLFSSDPASSELWKEHIYYSFLREK